MSALRPGPVPLAPQVPLAAEGAATPVLEGWFTLDAAAPQLLGTRCSACGTYYFPRQKTFCRNPDCNGTAFEEVALSRSGRLWSYTSASYAPPAPFVAREPFEPFAIAAVELERERMVVLGPVIDGVRVEDLRVGMSMELALEPLADGKLTWKWKPATEPAAAGRADAPLPRAGEGGTARGAGGGERGAR